MTNNNIVLQTESLESKNLKELRRLLSLKGDNSEKKVQKIWHLLKKMQNDLELPSLYPIKLHYHFYQKLREIQKSLNLTLDFIQLNELYNEITALRELLGLPETTPISKIIKIIQKKPLERLAALGIRHDSLLLKILLIHSTMNENDMTKIQERLPLTNDLDFVIFGILQAYGPLSRSELVQLTNTPRSTVYDSLQRLISRGFVTQFSGKRSLVGRPVTLFDVVI